LAPRRKPYNQLSKSGKRYRDNAKARKKKAARDKKINARESQKAKRRELAKKNYHHDKKHGKSSRRNKDWDHAKGRYVSQEENRGRRGEGGRKRKG
jgi:hypothetical protein